MNDEKAAERIESAAEYFEREEYVLADRAHGVRTALVSGFVVAVFGASVFMPNPEQAGTLALLCALPATWLFKRWRRLELARLDKDIRMFWAGGFTKEQIIAVRGRVQDLRKARNPARHQSPPLPLDRHLNVTAGREVAGGIAPDGAGDR